MNTKVLVPVTVAFLARGSAPVQLDAAGRTNLSGIGPPGSPKVALIGPRGLTENNDTPCPLWYLLAQHSPRTLVERVAALSLDEINAFIRRFYDPALFTLIKVEPK